MKGPKTDSLVEAYFSHAIRSIKLAININRSIYLTTLVIIVGILFMLFRLQGQQYISVRLATESLASSVKNSARIDANEKQQLDYIDRMVKTIDKLQRDNPRLRVPKAPEERPAGLPLPTEKELERTPVSPSPTPVPRIIRKKDLVKQPFRWPWEKK
jgi:hypothetical protein